MLYLKETPRILYILLWDFDDPNSTNASRDPYAGAIYASVLLEWQAYVSNDKR
ncbi:hypothetical protein [Aestuariivivens sediminis]|uniref:hypothetical protein n=1 Tax=Aestuariivivens sediminis TaxID=2913557 RepID=UPI001F584AC3|nr:hypothetical protein [Aestuariivivens sediminis]